MSQQLRIWALPITAVRQFFAAPPAEAERLTALAEPLMITTGPAPAPGLLGKLGPLTKRQPARPVIVPGVPNRHDLAALLAGHYIEADRLSAAWRLVSAWLDGSASQTATIGLDPAALDRFEFDLGRCEVPAEVSIRRLWGRPLEIPLRPLLDQQIGYLPGPRVDRLRTAWRQARTDLDQATTDFVDAILAVVESSQDAGTGQPTPDLVASWAAS